MIKKSKTSRVKAVHFHLAYVGPAYSQNMTVFLQNAYGRVSNLPLISKSTNYHTAPRTLSGLCY